MGRRNLTVPAEAERGLCHFTAGPNGGLLLAQRLLGLMALLAVGLGGPLGSGVLLAQPVPLFSLEERLGQLKTDFEARVAGISDQKTVAALAMRYASEAWTLASEAHSPEDTPWVAQERRDWLNRLWADQNIPWSDKEVSALRLYFEALSSVCAAHLSEKPDQSWAYQELASVIRKSSEVKLIHENKFSRENEDKVFWSNRLAAVMSVLVRLKNTDKASLDDITDQLAQKAIQIANRRDVHYQGRMELLFLNNSQGLARMHFLLAKSDSSPIISEANNLEQAWREHLAQADNPINNQVSLTWLTTAQLTFPLAFWLGGPP
ncbi:MAG: hypothetical protein LBP22_13910 [Deltaproteobacteria bacterium]|nr:hypothetical protein [Deltaproteobacteria bacterium]